MYLHLKCTMHLEKNLKPKTGGREKSIAVAPSLLAGVTVKPETAEQWLGNARIVGRMMAAGITAKAMAEALKVSQSMVCVWGKAGRRWPDAVKLDRKSVV